MNELNLAFFKHPFLRPLCVQFVNVLEQVEDDVIDVHWNSRSQFTACILRTDGKDFCTPSKLKQWKSSRQSQTSYSQRPSAVKSIFTTKNMKPLAPSFGPPTRESNQPGHLMDKHVTDQKQACLDIQRIRCRSPEPFWFSAACVPFDFRTANRLPGPSWAIRWAT